MARNPKISLDVEFNEVDRAEVDRITKQLGSALRKVDSREWLATQNKIKDA